MTRKPKFDRTAAFKSIVGADAPQEEEARQAKPLEKEAVSKKDIATLPQQIKEASTLEPTETVTLPVSAETASPPEPQPLVTIPQRAENRTMRKQLLLPPTLGRAAERKARSMGLSLNEVVNQLLARWLEGP